MFPRQRAALLGLSALGVFATLSGAEAGHIYYTKNGHKYWLNKEQPSRKSARA